MLTCCVTKILPGTVNVTKDVVCRGTTWPAARCSSLSTSRRTRRGWPVELGSTTASLVTTPPHSSGRSASPTHSWQRHQLLQQQLLQLPPQPLQHHHQLLPLQQRQLHPLRQLPPRQGHPEQQNLQNHLPLQDQWRLHEKQQRPLNSQQQPPLKHQPQLLQKHQPLQLLLKHQQLLLKHQPLQLLLKHQPLPQNKQQQKQQQQPPLKPQPPPLQQQQQQ